MTAKYPERKVLFPGSFNPFTVGHASLVERALVMFDRVVIAVGVNASKSVSVAAEAERRCAAIAELYRDEPRVEVIVFRGLVVDAVKASDACALLKGVRTVADFEYERQMADINRELAGVETVLLYALPRLASVSSSVVRELASHGVDVARYLPPSPRQ